MHLNITECWISEWHHSDLDISCNHLGILHDLIIGSYELTELHMTIYEQVWINQFSRRNITCCFQRNILSYDTKSNYHILWHQSWIFNIKKQEFNKRTFVRYSCAVGSDQISNLWKLIVKMSMPIWLFKCVYQ